MPDGVRNPELAMQMIRDAEAAGLHSSKFRTVCDLCREWCDGIYYVSPQTGTRMCRKCAGSIGVVKPPAGKAGPT